MKPTFKTALLFLLLMSAGGLSAQPSWPEVKPEMKAGSRWWWMASAVDETNLQSLMEQYAAAGIGTLEITPIYGVKGNAAQNVTYLSARWFELLKHVQAQGQRLGIAVDMTMGTGWPFGGQMVKPEESASKLQTETTTITGDGSTTATIALSNSLGTLQRVLAFPKTGTEGSPIDLTDLRSGTSVRWVAPAGQWDVITVYCQPGVMQVKRPSPGSEGYALDYFDSTAVANYLKYFEQRFQANGEPYPDMFFNDSYEITQADWTRGIFEAFLKYRGYRLEEHMDQLLARDRQVYADYRQTLSDMLRDNFTRQWTEWAHSHGTQTRNQAHGSPGNLIDLYAEADIPETETFYMNDFGIKGLRRDDGFTMKALSSLATLKYASSAAHITGKRLVSSESLTWLTEHFRSSLSQMKPELDQLFVAGVNHVMFHGTTYSPSTAAWPGWKFYASVDMSPTNSIWRDAPELMKYIERVQSFMQMGQPDNDLLVYAPFVNAMQKNTGSFQNRLLLFDINTLDTKMADLKKCVDALLAAGYDCDYTSDRYLLTTTFEGGQLKTASGASYKALIVPVSDAMPDEVRNHLDALATQGAMILYQYTDLSQLTVKPEAMRQSGLGLIRRKNDSGHHYFIANLTANDFRDYVELAVPFASAALFNPLTGDIRPAKVSDGRIYIDLKSGQSMLLQTYDSNMMADEIERAEEAHALAIGGEWRLSFTDDTWPDMSGRHYTLSGPQTWETLDEQTAQVMGTGVYETNFTLTESQMQMATGGFRLDLGDVRESARVWLNGQYLGCAWSVPFELDASSAVRQGENSLRIEVTNLPANRIHQMDAAGTEWRIFEDINMSNISSASYSAWALMPSGLASAVKLVPMVSESQALTARLIDMQIQDDGTYLPVYQLQTNTGEIVSLTATDADGQPYTSLSVDLQPDGSALLTLASPILGDLIITATDVEGEKHFTTMPAYGSYERTMNIDFTAEEEPGGGWQKLTAQGQLSGFSGTTIDSWYRSKLNGREVTGLYEGLSFSSTASNYYFYYPGFGMNANNDFRVTMAVADGTIAQLSYMVGEGSTTYDAADSLCVFRQCEFGEGVIELEMPGNKRYHVYRMLSVFQPVSIQNRIELIGTRPNAAVYYTLQGVRRTTPRKGIYIRDGRKVVVK